MHTAQGVLPATGHTDVGSYVGTKNTQPTTGKRRALEKSARSHI
jgi:hypothetical protein